MPRMTKKRFEALKNELTTSHPSESLTEFISEFERLQDQNKKLHKKIRDLKYYLEFNSYASRW